MFTKVICVKTRESSESFDLGGEYTLFNGYITDSLGNRWVWGSWGNNYTFEVVK